MINTDGKAGYRNIYNPLYPPYLKGEITGKSGMMKEEGRGDLFWEKNG
jgi:hypothetical protein